MKAGRWAMWVVENGFNRTALGVVFYDREGNLVGQRFRSTEEAVIRGDLPEKFADYEPEIPLTWKQMSKKLDSDGNAMAVMKWTGGHPTTVWDWRTIDRFFQHEILGRR